LKLLEEPPELVHFILTAHSVEPLLPTIRSRVQHVHILPISDVQSGEIAEASPHRDQLLFIANGRPAELMRLLADNTYFSHESRRFRAAKTFLAASRYDRLIMITAISSRLEMLRFIDTLTVVARASLASTPRADTIQLLESLLATRQTLAANGNVKLQALRTVV
ncbi:MAG TPA: hypothetical protein VFQ70_02780, partial [Candidatus Saccharimonadaceae bacterium]|nr:hypothetical protein [Candidatus Saccharimonadaceae bacterium]